MGRHQLLQWAAQLGAEYDADIAALIEDLRTQIDFARGELSEEEEEVICKGFRRLCSKPFPKDWPPPDPRHPRMLLQDFDPEGEAPNGAPVYCLTKASRKGSRTKPVEGVFDSQLPNGMYQIVVNDKVLVVHPDQVTVYINWEELMIMSRIAKCNSPQQFQSNLERLSNRHHEEKRGTQETITTLPLDRENSVIAPNDRTNCRANCAAGCSIQ